MAEFGWLYEIGELSRQNVYDAVFDWVMDVASAHKIKTKVVVCVCLCVCIGVCKYSVTFGEHESENRFVRQANKKQFYINKRKRICK